jgi:hypothetical protein
VTKNSPSTSNQLLIGRRPGPEYVSLLKKILQSKRHEEMELVGVGAHGNSKVIWIANRMIKWGYIVVTKIKTKEPSSLEITVKKSSDFDRVCDEFDKIKAARAALYKEKQAEKAAADAAVKAAAEIDKETEA